MIEVVRIGTPVMLQSGRPGGAESVVFEDDGDTAYFYALAPGETAMELLDALHVYNAEESLRGVDCRIELSWSQDGARAGLRMNATLWALFDFEAQRGWSRSNFPPPAGRWRVDEARPVWDDALVRRL